MNEFCAVSAEELNQADGGIVPVIAAGVILLASCIDSDTTDIEDREPLPGFNKFLDEVADISRQSWGRQRAIPARGDLQRHAGGSLSRRTTQIIYVEVFAN